MAHTHIIAVAGKGGVGKTTTCGMIIDYLCKQKKGPILVVDADANSNLNEVLGVEVETTLVEGLFAGHGVFRHAEVGQLNADLGCVLDLSVERVERKHVLAADGRGLVANAQHNFIDVRIERLFLGNERHSCESPYKNIVFCLQI